MILYEDNHILVVNKPAGMLTQRSSTETRPSTSGPKPDRQLLVKRSQSPENLEDTMRDYLKEKYKKPGNVFLHAVHRIDREVSGAVIFAKTSKALSRLNEFQRQKKIIKIYYGLVEGIIGNVSNEVILKHSIKHEHMKAKISNEAERDSKEALLRYKVLKTYNDFSLIEIYLTTGRYHQIRAQLSYAGFPIVGDKKYGSKRNFTNNGIALHSRYLEFSHPIKKETVKVTALYPSLWEHFLLAIPL